MAIPNTPLPAAAPAGRQLPFFDVVPVRDIHDLASSPEIFKNASEISCLAPAKSGLLLADIHGSIHLLNKDFESVIAWIAHTGGRVTHMVERSGVLVTLGEEDSVRYPLMKIWDLRVRDKKTGAPVLMRSVKVQHGNQPHPVSCIALSASLSHLAIGLGGGAVLLYRHLDQSLASGNNNLTSVPKPRTVHESPSEAITGIGFREPTEESQVLDLFIVTLNRVLVYQATGRGSGGPPNVVDEVGAALGCAEMDWIKKDIVVARDEAVYICGVEGRGICYAYEGPKSSIHIHRNYLVIVTPPFMPSASAASATVRHFVARTAETSNDITKVTIYDLDNKILTFSGAFPDGVREVVSIWGHIYVLSNDGKLSCLQEKPMPVKLDMLYRKSWYGLALNMAKSQKLDGSSFADIHRQYGDYLYSKGEYDSAMQQFVQTIGHVQPSYVIRKFLDAQRIHNLVTYLQELHSLGLANSDHTTLLLNTYTKLKDVARLDSFIKTESTRRSSFEDGDIELPFDLDTAIRVCRQAGYFEHASYLAKKYGCHEDYLRIQIEDAGNYKDALLYLRRLGADAAESNLARYGRAMLDNLPEETTQLLIDICINTGPLDIESELPSPTRQATAGPSYLSFVALNRNKPSESSPPPSTIATARPGDQHRRQQSVADDVATISTATSALAAFKPLPIKRPSPRLYFAHFVDHLDWFMVFLETVAQRRWGHTVEGGKAHDHVDEPVLDEEAEKQDQIAVWNTLLELYLSQPTKPKPAEGSAAGTQDPSKSKALQLLRSKDLPYDPMHALLLCTTSAYTPGLVLLWEKLGMQEDVLRFWMDKHNAGNSPDASPQVIRSLEAYGPTRPQLYPLVLRFLTSTPELLQKHTRDITVVLEHIEDEKIMSPVTVVQVLSRNGVASVGLVKQWLMTRIKEARDEIHTDEQLIDSYRMETKSKLKQVADLSDPDQPRVFHVTRCSRCNSALDLPAVHFMCNHSYHQRCLADNETECPNCARAHGVIREIRRNNERLADQHDLFLSEVQENGFEATAAAFGRGVMSMPRPEDAST